MAAIAPSQYIVPQVVPAAQASTLSQDPLFEALKKYLTSGSQSLATTETEIQELLNDASTAPGGRAYLEALTSAEETPAAGPLWKNSRPMVGDLNLWLGFYLKLRPKNLGIPMTFQGSGFGVFPQQDVKLDGTVYWNDEVMSGETKFVMRLTQIGLVVDFYKGELIIARFIQKKLFPHMPPKMSGTGSWST